MILRINDSCSALVCNHYITLIGTSFITGVVLKIVIIRQVTSFSHRLSSMGTFTKPRVPFDLGIASFIIFGFTCSIRITSTGLTPFYASFVTNQNRKTIEISVLNLLRKNCRKQYHIKEKLPELSWLESIEKIVDTGAP